MPPSDRDLSALLPEPPPPRPDRRDAAIAAAVRRFDGAGEDPSATAKPATPVRWWASLGGPQIGAFVTAALVAAIGLPVWLASDHRPAPVRQPVNAVASAADSAADQLSAPVTADVAPTPPAKVDSLPPGEPPPVLAAAPPVAEPLARADASTSPAKEMKPEAAIADKRNEDRFAAALPAAPSGIAAAPRPAPPPPPPPAAELAMAADASDAGNIVVTGSRVSAGRARVARALARPGDWNACTVNDPRQSLAACRKLVSPSAQGAAGRAGELIGDGLSRAWRDDTDGSIAAFDKAIDAAPRLAPAYLNRGLAYERAGDLDRAIADLDLAVRYAPNAARGYYHRSILLRRRGDARRADADESRAVSLDPRYEAVLP